MFRIIVEGDYACFTRPECKVERASYPVPTPSALEGLIKSIYWKPAIRYVIDKIVVFNPINYYCIRRNERKEKVLLSKVKQRMKGKDEDPALYFSTESINQRATLLLKNVKYGIEFHFEMTGICSEAEDEYDSKHANILRRRLEKGQFFKVPTLGCREFATSKVCLVEDFDLTEVDSSLKGETDLGVMLYGLKFKDNMDKLKENWSKEFCSDDAEAVFYHPYMQDGVIDVARFKEVRS